MADRMKAGTGNEDLLMKLAKENGLDLTLRVFMNKADVPVFCKYYRENKYDISGVDDPCDSDQGYMMTVDFVDEALTAVMAVFGGKLYLDLCVRDSMRSFTGMSGSIALALDEKGNPVDDPDMQENMKELALAILSVRRYLLIKGVVGELYVMRDITAGAYVKIARNHHVSAKIVKGEDRPELPCEDVPSDEPELTPYILFEVTDDVAELERYILLFDRVWKKELEESNEAILNERTTKITRANDSRIKKIYENTGGTIKKHGDKLCEVMAKLDEIGDGIIAEGKDISEIAQLISMCRDKLRMSTSVEAFKEKKNFKYTISKKYLAIAGKWKDMNASDAKAEQVAVPEVTSVPDGMDSENRAKLESLVAKRDRERDNLRLLLADRDVIADLEMIWKIRANNAVFFRMKKQAVYEDLHRRLDEKNRIIASKKAELDQITAEITALEDGLKA